MALTLHRAERADQIIGPLAAVLAEPSADPFARDLVVVSALGVERWLAQSLSHRLGTSPGRDDGICAAVEMVRPAHLVAELTDRERDDPWSPGRLAWTVLDVIDEAIDEPWLDIVARHLGRQMAPADEAVRRSRRYPTARRTASLLHSYALQRPSLVERWRRGDDDHVPPECRWQAEVWRRAETLLAPHPAPDVRLAATAQALRDGTAGRDLPERVSFVGHTRMPRAELAVVAALAEHRDVHLWLPSPSRTRWEEVARQTGAQVGRRAELAVPDRGNALLTACARDATELELALLAAAPGVAVDHLPSPERPDTLLGWLQDDIAADRDGPDRDRRLGEADRSVQVHACHGAGRQVDVLREVVVGLLADDPTLEPRDILVMCPDVEAYAPYIQAAFGDDDAERAHPGHHLRVRLADRATGSINPIAEVLQRVVAVAAGGRTTASQVRDLVATEPVRRRFGFTDDDLERLDSWLDETAVRWGLDADAREPWGLGGLAQNTWRAGLDRLLVGVAATPDSGARPGAVLPLDDLTSTDVDLVGRLAEVIDRLGSFVRAARPQPLAVWTGLLIAAARGLTDAAPRDAWQIEQVVRILVDLDDAGGELSVTEVGAVLDDVFGARPTRSSFRTGSLTVCTMVPMRSVPHRVVCLLGLDADAFPRTPTPLGDDVLARDPLVGERDRAAEDRQLFLDAIMSATDTLVVTYTGASEHTGRTLPPATPVGELLDQLDRTVPGADVRDHVLVRHPLQAFDPRSFTPGALVPEQPFSFDAAAFAGATALGDAPRPPFLPAPLPPLAAEAVTLDDLRAFVAHPVRAFVRSRLDVVATRESEPPADDVPLALDALGVWQVSERVLEAVLAGRSGPDADLDERQRGLLPPGPLGDAVLAQVRDKVAPLVMATAELRAVPARSVDVDVTLPDGRRVVGTVADVRPGHGLRISTSRVTGRRLLEPWVDALALAAAGIDPPTDIHLVGRVPDDRSWVPGVRTLGALDRDLALRTLADLLDLWEQGMCAPLPLPVKASLSVAEALRHRPPAVAAERGRRDWAGNRDSGIDGEDADAYHVFAFGAGHRYETLLEAGMPALAERLWHPLLDHLREGW